MIVGDDLAERWHDVGEVLAERSGEDFERMVVFLEYAIAAKPTDAADANPVHVEVDHGTRKLVITGRLLRAETAKPTGES